jgi:hypothetical protein
MKNLDVTFNWNNTNYTMLYSVPNTTTASQVMTAIKNALNTYNGNVYLSLSNLMDGQTLNDSKGIQPNTTVVQIQNAIIAGVTSPIIGGRSRRG